MNINDKLSQVFGVEPIVIDQLTSEIVSVETKSVTEDQALDHDYNTTRANLHQLLQQGQDALIHSLEVAKQSEHPRAFEVVGNLMKHLSDINHQLLDLHKKKQALDAPKGGESNDGKNVTNNSIFVGSTTELSRMLADLKKEK